MCFMKIVYFSVLSKEVQTYTSFHKCYIFYFKMTSINFAFNVYTVAEKHIPLTIPI